jgi:predicted dehydrogenase
LKRSSNAKQAYLSTSLHENITSYVGDDPDAVFIGTPPASRGTLLPGQNIEFLITQKFPSTSLFVEKPISSATMDDMHPLTMYFQNTKTFVSVGYMFRYLKGLNPQRSNKSRSENETDYRREGDYSCFHKRLVSIDI